MHDDDGNGPDQQIYRSKAKPKVLLMWVEFKLDVAMAATSLVEKHVAEQRTLAQTHRHI